MGTGMRTNVKHDVLVALASADEPTMSRAELGAKLRKHSWTSIGAALSALIKEGRVRRIDADTIQLTVVAKGAERKAAAAKRDAGDPNGKGHAGRAGRAAVAPAAPANASEEGTHG